MHVYRICSRRYSKDLSGKGAALYGGCWNSKDTYIVYTAESRALALLETVVHMGRIPAIGYCICSIYIPDDSIAVHPVNELPIDWFTNPPPNYIKAIGDDFIREGRHLALKIPSAIMQEEHNYLLNPKHPKFEKVYIDSERSIAIDERLYTTRH